MSIVATTLLAGCGSSSSTSTHTSSSLLIALGTKSIVVGQDGTAVSVPVTITGPTGTPTVTVSGLPTGFTTQFSTSSSAPSGTLAVSASTSMAPGSYTGTVTVALDNQTASAPISITGVSVATVSKGTDTALGVDGVLKQFMSNNFQVAQWDGNFFGTNTTAREATLNAMNVQHIRLQSTGESVPMQADNGTASDWDFTILDRTVQPVLGLADTEPELQIAIAPAWMCDSDGHLDVTNHLSDFATYAANLVKYYNKGGFTYGGSTFKSASSTPIKYWGIFNEPAYNSVTPAQYVAIYNAVVPAMKAVDSSIKFVAIEYSGSVLSTGWDSDPEVYLPTLFAAADAGGLNAQVDYVANHFYSTCQQSDSDATVFATIPKFAAVEKYLYDEIKSRSDLASVPVWTTENNVNADYANSSGMSSCDPTKTFVVDQRGSSVFFAAWRPYIFSQLGKAGNQALYNWTYSGNNQYGEVDTTGTPYLSYWVDKALTSFFPATPTSSTLNLQSTSVTDSSVLEALATEDATSGVVTVMIVNHGVASSTDNNGSGVSRSLLLDTSSFGTFSSATETVIDASTSLTSGPTSSVITSPSSRLPISTSGYGVTFVKLIP